MWPNFARLIFYNLILFFFPTKIANTKMATPNTDYNKYTNDELKQMIDELVKNNMMEIDLLGKLNKFLFNDDDINITKDDEPLNAEKRHQIYNHYKYKLIIYKVGI